MPLANSLGRRRAKGRPTEAGPQFIFVYKTASLVDFVGQPFLWAFGAAARAVATALSVVAAIVELASLCSPDRLFAGMVLSV